VNGSPPRAMTSREKKSNRPRVTKCFIERFTIRGRLSIVFHPSSFQ